MMRMRFSSKIYLEEGYSPPDSFICWASFFAVRFAAAYLLEMR